MTIQRCFGHPGSVGLPQGIGRECEFSGTWACLPACRSREEIKRLSQIAKDYERQLKEVSRCLPGGL